jgi:hypothetical protein
MEYIVKPYNDKTARRITDGTIKGFIRTRSGKNVRLLCNDANGAYPLVGIIQLELGDVAHQWTLTGKTDTRPNVTTPHDLVMFVPDEEGGAAV